ncbi:MAG TPA: GNAT family N-acetyltransferase [Anaerolineae bacterium]|nr:GNAT family N-acetyltransferase [Anaerolineae bacterium]
MVEYYVFELSSSIHHAMASALWTKACGQGLALSPRAIEYNTRPGPGVQQAGRFAFVGNDPVGFILASALEKDMNVLPNEGGGWIDALVVAPELQRRGTGQALLAWAEDWLRERECASARLGASLRWFAPGVPIELDNGFFQTRGYIPRENGSEEWDLGRDLQEYTSPSFIRTSGITMRPARVEDIEPLRDFLAREFPGRWRYQFEQHLYDGGDISEFILLESERGVDACCQVTFEESVRRAERFYPSPLPHPWGQVGSIGVSADRRGAGYGSALLDASLHHLRERGVRGCIIDWTDLISYYERFGFVRHRAYRMLSKQL